MTVLEYIKENNLTWQPSFGGKLENGKEAYRGALIVEDGKQISPDRKLPPKIQLKQVVCVTEEKIDFIAGELESFDHFEPFFAKYGEFLNPDSLNMLFVIDLDSDVIFEYENFKFYAYSLDESSVWNELLDKADLEKSDLKKLSSENKIETLFDELKISDLSMTEKSYEEAKTLKNTSVKKQMMGAV
jgi:hypothetical protein